MCGSSARRVKVEPKGFGQLQDRDSVIVSSGDQLRNLIEKLHLSLKDIETRHGSGLETVLLVFQLTLQKSNRFLLHDDQLAIYYHLVELRLYRGNDLVDAVSQSEVGGVALKERAANRGPGCSVKNQLSAGDLDVVGNIAAQIFDATDAHAGWSTSWGRCGSECRKRGVFLKIWISPTPSR